MILSFHKAFVPMVLDGSKRQTIRAGSRWKAGMRADLYTGAYRPGERRLLFRSVATKAETIEICCDLETRPDGWPSADLAPLYVKTKLWIAGIELSMDEATELAWQDGFRAETCDRRKQLSQMLRYLGFGKQSKRFAGQIIHWDYERREVPD